RRRNNQELMVMGTATGPAYKVPLKRRRKSLTNYLKRLGLVKSKIPRMVVRKSAKHVLVQFIQYAEGGDRTISSALSKELSKFGWPDRCNTPTAYLTGMLAAKKAMKKGVKSSVLDVGLQTPSKGSVLFAAAKGAIGAGVLLSVGEGMSDEAREKGVHIENFAKTLKGKPEYEKKFSAYIKAGIQPEQISGLFEKTKGSISRGDVSG
ncbi:MAG: 50S ribosomal protein L18, partial [Candidatus Micrarchaeota archaeon]